MKKIALFALAALMSPPALRAQIVVGSDGDRWEAT